MVCVIVVCSWFDIRIRHTRVSGNIQTTPKNPLGELISQTMTISTWQYQVLLWIQPRINGHLQKWRKSLWYVTVLRQWVIMGYSSTWSHLKGYGPTVALKRSDDTVQPIRQNWTVSLRQYQNTVQSTSNPSSGFSAKVGWSRYGVPKVPLDTKGTAGFF